MPRLRPGGGPGPAVKRPVVAPCVPRPPGAYGGQGPQPPELLFWSLGNESGCGGNHFAMAERAREMDSTRLIHYERCPEAEMADVYGSMYTHPDEFAVLGRQAGSTNPTS